MTAGCRGKEARCLRGVRAEHVRDASDVGAGHGWVRDPDPPAGLVSHPRPGRSTVLFERSGTVLAPPRVLGPALASGWQIATGIIEGAARFLIKDRMDITGARWSTPGAQAVLRLRAVIANGDFDEYWKWHQQQELRRNHLDRYQELDLAA